MPSTQGQKPPVPSRLGRRNIRSKSTTDVRSCQLPDTSLYSSPPVERAPAISQPPRPHRPSPNPKSRATTQDSEQNPQAHVAVSNTDGTSRRSRSLENLLATEERDFSPQALRLRSQKICAMRQVLSNNDSFVTTKQQLAELDYNRTSYGRFPFIGQVTN